jgi:hypothetical protein
MNTDNLNTGDNNSNADTFPREPLALRQAQDWLKAGYWPVAISPITSTGPNPGKKPLGGPSWGKERPTPERLRALYQQHPDAGLGLLLGCEGGVVDLDVDDPEAAAPALARLFPDGLPETRGWTSNGNHFHLLFRYDARLAKYGKRVIKGAIKDGKIIGNEHYLGLELRIGTTDPKDPCQAQSVIPPSRKADGTRRRWEASSELLDLPITVFEDLDKHAAQKQAPRAPNAGPAGKAGQPADQNPARTGRPTSRLEEALKRLHHDPAQLDTATAAIQYLKEPYYNDDQKWLQVGRALFELGQDGLALWEEWSTQAANYEEGRCIDAWNTLVPGGTTLANLYQWAKEAGWPGREIHQPPTIPYLTHNGVICIYHTREDADGHPVDAHIPICNFDARIIAQITTQQGANTYQIDYRLKASKPTWTGAIISKEIQISAREFIQMDWPVTHLGGDWSIESDRKAKDQVREAIQLLSGKDGITEYTGYDHTGWVKHAGADYYLHAGGALGPNGPVIATDAGFVVDLAGALPLYALPDPSDGDQLQVDVQAVLAMRDLGRTARPNAQGIAAALAALPWRAALGPCPFAVVLAGGSGGYKTSLGCLATQHFAPQHSHNSDHQAPTTWEATVAHLEWLAHRAKDTVLCIDNFIADATKAAQQQAKASTIINNQGDLHGRERMGPDMRPLPSLPPRCGLLSTGEDTAARGSAKGRSLLVQVTRGATMDGNSVVPDQLTPLQADAAQGSYARAMAAYIQYIAQHGLNQYQSRLVELTTKFRDAASSIGGHARTPSIIANLAAGYRLFLEWAEHTGAINSALEASTEHWQWLLTLAPDQATEMEASDDAIRWRDLLHSALGVGRAYLAGPDGKTPDSHQAECGWKHQTWTDKKGPHEYWGHPPTTRIGWYDGDYIYLDEQETTIVVQDMASQQNHQLSQPATVKARLVEKGWLQTSTEAGKTRYTKKVELEGTRRRVWQIALNHFWPPDPDPDE